MEKIFSFNSNKVFIKAKDDKPLEIKSYRINEYSFINLINSLEVMTEKEKKMSE